MPPSADPNATPTSKLVTSPPVTPASTPTTSAPGTSPSDAPPPEHHGHGHGKNPFTSLASSYTSNVTAAVYDANTGQTFVLHPGVEEYTASIVKVEIMGTILHNDQAQGGTPFGSQETLLTSMIEQSDNSAATQLLSDAGGPPAVKSFDDSVGMTATSPHDTTPYIDNDPSLPAWGLTTTTALDEVRLVKAFAYRSSVLTPASQTFGIGLMTHIEADQAWGVTSGTTGATVALKNGWLPVDVTNNADWQVDSIGWIHGNGRNYVLAVLTKHNTSEQSGIEIISRISQTVFGALG